MALDKSKRDWAEAHIGNPSAIAGICVAWREIDADTGEVEFTVEAEDGQRITYRAVAPRTPAELEADRAQREQANESARQAEFEEAVRAEVQRTLEAMQAPTAEDDTPVARADAPPAVDGEGPTKATAARRKAPPKAPEGGPS